ncbi:MAG: metal-dependent transcriptional regulator [Anaerolineae bacterium]|nr:metal-dependent transcriptional regulator [Anaerolineae bacterium]
MQAETHPNPNDQISETMRDYLGEIYRLGQGKAWVSTTALAEQLNVSGPATVRMVRRLHKNGLVEHLPYKGVRFTPSGQRAALLNIRRHRLVECFLVDVLKFGWHEVHYEADVMQKGVNQRLEDRIDDMLNHPATCPHGEPIPSREGVMPQVDDRPLTVLPPGARGSISRTKTHEPKKLKYLAEIGLVPGASFELVNRAPFNGPLRLKIGRAEQVIGMELAAALWVFPPNTPPKSA